MFPTTYIELASYPFLTSFISFAQRGQYGAGAQVASDILFLLFTVLFAVIAVYAVAKLAGLARRQPKGSRLRGVLASDAVRACLLALAVYLGVLVAADVCSRVMDSFMLYYRYLFVAIGPLLVAASLVLARVRSRALAASMLAVIMGLSLLNQALQVRDDYDARNQEPLTAFQEAVEQATLANALDGDASERGSQALALSSDIGFQGVTSVLQPGIRQTYLDWQKGNWGLAYQAYDQALTSVKSWEVALGGYTGQFVVQGQSQNGTTARDVTDLARKPGVQLLETHTYYRPYERTYFTVAILQKTQVW